MYLTFLGTGAATADPLPFCRCAHCVEARARGGRDLRMRSSLLINEDLLIDLGPDVFSGARLAGVDLSKVRYLAQTHAHADHFDAGHLLTRMHAYACVDPQPLALVMTQNCAMRASAMLDAQEAGASLLDAQWRDRLRIALHIARLGESITLGAYTIQPIECAHDVAGGAVLYAIADGSASLLYALDTPALTEGAWETLSHFSFDAVVIDQTYGIGIYGDGHMCADEVADTVDRMRQEGILHADGHAFASHISHEGMPTHTALTHWAQMHGYTVAWDGLKTDVGM